MRHCIFLPVLLSLVLSFSKGNTITIPSKVSIPASTGNTTTTPSEEPTPAAPEYSTTTPSKEPTPTAPENDTTTLPETPTPKPPGNTTITPSTVPGNTTTTPSEEPTPAAPEYSTTTPSKEPTPTAPGNTTTTPSEEPTPAAPEYSTTTPSKEPTPTAPENDTTTLPEIPTPKPPGNTTITPSTVPGNTTTTPSEEPTPAAPEYSTTTPSKEPTPTAPENDTTTLPEIPTPKPPGNTTITSSTVPVNWCATDPCGESSARCVALYSYFFCQCHYGFYYSNKNCHKGKIFPGFITLNVPYSDSVQDVGSMSYEQVFLNVTAFFKSVFNESDLGQTLIVKIEAQRETRSLTTGSMNLTVINLFMENSNVTNETVSSAIIKAIESTNYVSDYREATYCAAFNCDAQTTVCEENVFPKCICKDTFLKTEWDDRSCSDCSNCYANANKFCEKENGIPKCKCMPNFLMEYDTCVPCPVGYAGVDCNNNHELILIIVGTVFGAIILALVIAVSVVSVRAKTKQDPEKKRLIKSGYSNPSASDERQTSMFPRVKTTSGHANPGYQPNNPYGMRSPDRGWFSEQDDDLYGISREPEGFRLQNRY